MSDINFGVYVGEKSGKEYTVLKSDFPLSCGSGSASRVETDVNLGPYRTECGLPLAEPNSDDKLFCSDLSEFLVKKQN